MRKLLPKVLLILFAVILPCGAQPASQSSQLLTNGIRDARAFLNRQPSKLTPAEFNSLAEAMARTNLVTRSNYFAPLIVEKIAGDDFAEAGRLLKEYPGSIDDLRQYGQPLLYTAVTENKSNLLDFLLEQKANPDAAPPFDGPVLMQAIQYRHWEAALKLIQAGASVTRTNNQGRNAGAAFFESWYPGNATDGSVSNLVPLMLQRGLDPFAASRITGQNSILEECLTRESGYLGGMQMQSSAVGTRIFFGDLLLTNNPSPARRTPLGDTALHLAARWERTNAVGFLLAAGFDLDQTNDHGLTPLQAIVGAGGNSFLFNPVNLSYRIRSAGPISARTPLLPPGQILPPQPVTEWLLNQGAALDIFSAAGLGLTNELAAMLRANSALATARDGFGRTPLHYAVLNAGSFPGITFYGGAGSFSGRWSGQWGGPVSGQGFFISQGASVQVAPATNAPPPVIAMLLAAGADPSAATTKLVPQQRNSTPLPVGSTPLHLAARNGNTPVLRLLLTSRANARVADADGNTALHLAARTWQTNAIPLLLTARAPLEATNLISQTPLRAAVESGVSAAVAVLLDAGASPTNGLGNTTLMHLAAERGDIATLTVLLKHKLPLEARDAAGRTPFQKAVVAKNWNSLTFLRDKGANLQATNFAGDTALHLLAAQQDDTVYHQPDEPGLIQWQRKQLSTPGSWGGKAIGWLIKSKVLNPPPALNWTNTSLTTWLIERDARINATNRAGQTPLHALCRADWTRWYQTAQSSNRVMALLNAGANLEFADTNGLTPLHLAATNQSPQMFKFLLARAGPTMLNRPDAEGRTMLHRALENSRDSTERVTTLLATGADPNLADKQGRTPLHVVVQLSRDDYAWGRRAMCFALLTNGANPNLTDRAGRTPLNLAVDLGPNARDYSRVEVVQLLLANGANPNIADHDGNTPLHRVLGNHATNYQFLSWRIPILNELLKRGANPALTNRVGLTPLHIVARSTQPYMHALDLLRDAIAVTNTAFAVRDANGDTPMHIWAGSLPNCSSCVDYFGKILAVGDNASLVNAAGETPITLMLASSNSLASSSRAILAAGVTPESLSVPDRNGQPLLHRLLAVLNLGYFDSQQMLRRILTNKSLVNLTNAGGDTPLHIAIRRRDSWMPRILMEAGADPSLKNARGETPLRLASIYQPNGPNDVRPSGTRFPFFPSIRMRDQTDVNRWLDVDPGLASITNKDGITPLMAAADARKTNLIERLLELGAPMDALSALRLGRLDEFRRLLPNHARPLPITWPFDAVRFGQFEALQELATAGADIQTNDASGHSLLYRARAADNQPMVDWLRTQGCRETFFDALVEGDCAKAAAFIAANASCVTTPSPDGRPPFITAVAMGKPEMVSLLLEHGAKPDTQTAERWSALHIAAACDAVEIGQMLLKAGVTNSETASGLSPLQIAAAYGATNMIKQLIQNGADVNAASGGFKNSPLHWAVHMGRPNTVRLLLSLGADVNAKNTRNGGETPLALARVSGDGNNMGFGIPPEVRMGYPGGVNRPAEARASVVKLLEEAAAPK